MKNDNISDAEAIAKGLIALDSVSADCFFILGKINYDQGKSDKARFFFSKAQQYDCLRFRAPDEINEAIYLLTKKYSNVFLVDSKQRFEEQSKQGIPGNELLLEHVHPNIQGHKEIAKAFYLQILSSSLFSLNDFDNIDSLLSKFPVLPFDSLAGEYAYTKLIRGFPFYEKTDSIKTGNQIEEQAFQYTVTKDWYKAMDGLYQYAISGKNYPLALDVLRVRIIDNAYDTSFYSSAGEICNIMKKYTEAEKYYKEGFKLHPSFIFAKEIISLSLLDDRPENALRYLDYAIANNQSNINFRQLKTYLESIIKLKNKINLADEKQKQDIYFSIAENYAALGNNEVASDYYMKAQLFR